MAESQIKKDGLIYSEDLTVVRGIDSSSKDFNGKIPYGPLEISEDAFSGSNLKSFTIPDSVKELPPCLFENLSCKITEIRLCDEFPGGIGSFCRDRCAEFLRDAIDLVHDHLLLGVDAAADKGVSTYAVSYRIDDSQAERSLGDIPVHRCKLQDTVGQGQEETDHPEAVLSGKG